MVFIPIEINSADSAIYLVKFNWQLIILLYLFSELGKTIYWVQVFLMFVRDVKSQDKFLIPVQTSDPQTSDGTNQINIRVEWRNLKG